MTGDKRRLLERLPSSQSIREEAFQAALELATEGLILVEKDGRVLALNSPAQALMHSGLAILQGADFREALPEAITDSHHAFEDQWVEYVLRPKADGMVVNLRDVKQPTAPCAGWMKASRVSRPCLMPIPWRCGCLIPAPAGYAHKLFTALEAEFQC